MSMNSTVPRFDHMEPLWDRVDANRLRLAAFVVLFVGGSVLGFMAFVVAPITLLFVLRIFAESPADAAFDAFWSSVLTAGAVFAAAASVWAAFTLLRSEKWLLARLGAVLVPTGEQVDTKMALKDMAIAAGLGVAPALYLIDTRSTNAFVFAARRRRAVVGVTRGFLTKLSIDEQRAVFANLVARLRSGDTITSTGITALMWPVHAWRLSRLTAEEVGAPKDFEPVSSKDVTNGFVIGTGGFIPFIIFGMGFAIVSEFAAAGHRRSQLTAAEKADAEGMLLLKDPASMLTALSHCVDLNNLVPSAGEAFAELFYCWTGASTNDEADPEWRRVARLRQVLGVDGATWEPVAGHADVRSGFPPVAPRLHAPQESSETDRP